MSNALDAIYTTGGGGPFAAADTSQLWSIENPEVKRDVCTLDSAVDNSIASHLLEGKNLDIHYSAYITQEQVVAGLQFSVNVNRNISRLQTRFIIFFRARGDGSNTYYKEANLFYHPLGTNAGNPLRNWIQQRLGVRAGE